MNKELTEQEEIYYANFGYVNFCDLCENEYPIHKYDFDSGENENYIEYNGKGFYCKKCRE